MKKTVNMKMKTKMNMNMTLDMNMNMKMDIKMHTQMKRNLDVVMYSMMEPCDDCGAPMSNDCQACGSAQAHARRSISLEYLHKNKD
jgi:hypothetical protein